MMKTIFVAGPLSRGLAHVNVVNACWAADRLWSIGLAPFVPHLTATSWALVSPTRPESEWRAWCLAWLTKCDALYRIAGQSSGPDAEVAEAKRLGLPVFLEDDGLAPIHAWANK